MALALLKEISLVEEQAGQIEAEAQQKAREIVASAKKEAVVILQKVQDQAGTDAKEMIQAQQEKAVADIKAEEAKIQAQCLQIKEMSGRKLSNAVDYIVGRIVTNSDR